MSSDDEIEKITYESDFSEIRAITAKRFDMYNKTMALMCADAPISVLCLNPTLEKRLIRKGYVRVYDLIPEKIANIIGFSPLEIAYITSSVEQFISMS